MKGFCILFFLSIFCIISDLISQVTPNINSGNPAFPFPQFLDYGSGRKTLASVNSPGVPHAEMEQRTREAWQLVCNNTSPYPGTVVAGVQYLYPTAPNHCTCVEGDGYYLLGAALMGDKKYFDGYYMWAHDRAFQGVKRFVDGVVTTPNYGYNKGLSGAGSLGAGTGVNGGGINGNSATDGDVDVALALLIAYKQWGEKSGIVLNNNGWGGKEINYKEEALNYIRAMVDTNIFPLARPMIKYVSGDVGFDGYLKGGDSQGELTDWAFSTGYKGMDVQVRQQNYYYDYSAPAWFRQFRMLLDAENDNQFYRDQYKRVEASCDWLMGQHYATSNKSIPYLGKVSWTGGNTFTFGNYIPDGEDFRGPWRTIMNAVWHGNPTYTWDPVSHQAVDGVSNTYEYDMGVRYAKFLKNNQGAPWNNPCRSIGDLAAKPLTFKGPYTLLNGYTPEGAINGGSFPLNWIHGTGAASAIIGQDFELMGDMFRHCVIAWDAATGQNLNSRPIYFHEWFRLAGMLTLAGNFHAPSNMVAKPNLKVYHKVNKTFAYTNDLVTFTVSHRNYGSVDASGSVVKFGIPKDFIFVSSTKGSLVGDSVVWNVGTVPGFKTGGLAATIDSFKVTLKVGPQASGRYCTSASIACTNGFGWISNEYPNNITAVMERNCVDIVKRALKIEKTSSRKKVNPATNGEVVYKIKFENSSEAGWINGGRQGVRLAFAHEALATPTAEAANVLKYRLFHDAAEAYIDYGNYRVSYFMNDPSVTGYSAAGGSATWGMQNTIAEGVDKSLVTVTHEQIVPGSNADGKWNQRIVLQFSPQLATITQHLQQYAGSPSMVHEGGLAALRGVWRLFTNNYTNVDWSDDWSWDASKSDGDGGLYYPISEDYTDPNNLGVPINSWHKSACQTTTNVMKKILVEEWDGYVWRRVFGNGPMPGRDIENVKVTDTLPVGVTIKNFIRQNPLGVNATTTTLANGRTLITWGIPKMQVSQKDSIVFTAVIAGTCPNADQTVLNRAWIEAASESAIFDPDTIIKTCDPVTVCPDPTTMTKTSDKTTYQVGETVHYKIVYTQTQGSIANPSLNNNTDWTITGAGSSNVSFGSGKLTVGSGNSMALHDYSYGTNTLGDGIEGTVQIQASENDFGFVVRDNIYIRLSSSGGSNPTLVDIYNGTTKLNATSFSIPFFANSLDFRIKLNGGTLSMWLVPTGTAISGAAPIVQTGIPVKAGKAGVVHGIFGNNPYASHTVTSWRSHMDVAYNVVITDPIPSGIKTPTNITRSGVLASGVITWTLASGKANPMAYGASDTLKWDGKFDSCGTITNVAYVNTSGLVKNKFGVCYSIKCGTTPICVPPTTVSVSATKANLCVGEALSISGSANPTNTNYYYTWYKKGSLPGTPSKTYSNYGKNSVSVADSGTYILRVEDGNAGLATCYKESSVVIKVTPIPTIGDTSFSICSGGSFKIRPMSNLIDSVPLGTKYVWSIPTGTGFTGGSARVSPDSIISDTLINTGNVAVTATYTVTPVNGICTGKSFNVVVSVNPMPSVSDMVANTCSGVGFAVLPVNGVNGIVPASTTYIWNLPTINSTSAGKANSIGASSLSDTLSSLAEISGTAVYNLTPSSGLCQGTSFKVTVTVNPEPKISDFKDTVCSGASFSFNPINVVNGIVPVGTTYTWAMPSGTGFTGANGQSSAQIGVTDTLYNSGPSVATATYVVTPMSGSCKGKPFNFVIQVTPTIVPKVVISTPATTVCTGSSVKITSVVTDAGVSPKYQWRRNGALLTNETGSSYTTNSPSDNDLYVLEITSSEGCASPMVVHDTVKISVKTEVKPAVAIMASQDSVCEGSAVTFKANPGNGGTAPTFEWFVNNQSQGVASTKDSIVLNTLQSLDEVKVAMVSNSSCANPKDADTTYIVHVKSRVTPTVSISVDTMSICAGQKVVLTAQGINGGSVPRYIWMKGSTILDTTTSNIYSDSLNTSQDVSVTLLSEATCVTSASVTSSPINISVTPTPKPSVTVAGTPAIICSGQQVSFSANPIDGGVKPVYQWYINGGLQSGIDSVVFNTIGLQNSNDEVWVAMQSTALCAQTGFVLSNKVKTIIQQGIGAGKIGYDQEICFGATPNDLLEVESPKNVSSSSLTYSWETSLNNQVWTADAQNTKGYDFGAKTYFDTVYLRRIVKDPGTSGACNTAIGASVKIIVLPQLIGGAISKSQEICEGTLMATLKDSVSVTGGNKQIYKYEWENALNSGGLFTSVVGNGNQSSFTNSLALSNTMYYRRKVTSFDTAGNICGVEFSNEVMVKVNPNKDIEVSLDNVSSCVGKTAEFIATIVANGGSNPVYRWYYDGVLQGSITNVFKSNSLANAKAVSVVVLNDEKCHSIGGNKDSVSLITNIISSFSPNVSLLAPDATCVGETITINMDNYPKSSNNTYTWYLNGTTVLQTKTVNGISADSYIGSFANGDQVSVKVLMDPNDPLAQCATTLEGSSSEIALKIYSKPSPDIKEGDDTLCLGEQKNYTLSNSKGNIKWYKDGLLLADQNDSVLVVNSSGAYYAVESRASGLCPVPSDTIHVKVIKSPIANAGADQYVLNGTVVQLSGSGGGYYQWRSPVLLDDSTIATPTFNAIQTSKFVLIVSDSTRTCSSIDEVVVYVERPIVVVNTFSPNGDGVNDNWEIRNIDNFPLCLVKIYNRWGNLVWKSNGYSHPWDGTNIHNGQILPDGTYFYIIELNSQIFRDPLQGWVQIVK